MKAVSVLLLLLSVSALFISVVNGHAWMQCTDYTEENGRLWSEAKCRGWPRNYERAFQYQGYGFGADAGFNFQPNDAKPCRDAPSAGDYTTKYPMAKYSPGQRICLAWPPKNHVAATCGNPNINDAGTKIYRSGVNPTADPTLTQFRQNLVHDFGINTGLNGEGFQNCPNFCANQDKSLCTGCFNIPTNLALGKYTFIWEWGFNGPQDLYTTCFDVEIIANSGNSIAATYTKISPDAYKALLTAGTPDTPTQGSSTQPSSPTTPPAQQPTTPPGVPTSAPSQQPTFPPGVPTPAPTQQPTARPGETIPATQPASNINENSQVNIAAEENKGSSDSSHTAVVALSLIVAFMGLIIIVVVAVYVKTGSIFGYKLQRAQGAHDYQAYRS